MENSAADLPVNLNGDLNFAFYILPARITPVGRDF
jgi:hypothetical protein